MEKLKEYPCAALLKNGLFLIDGSERLLKPEEDRKFTTLYYIMRSIKKCKFVFVFSDHMSTEKGLKDIKHTFMQFISIFKNMDDSFWDSVAILITDSTQEATVKTYQHRILSEKGIREKIKEGK